MEIKNIIVILAIVGNILVLVPGWGSVELIRDVESLRNSIPLDDPSRPALTLRLADLYFDRALGMAQGATDGKLFYEELTEAQSKSLALYQVTMSGEGNHPSPNGDLRWKIKFQMARLYSDLKRKDKAIPLWRELSGQIEAAELRREAVLWLAEHYDETSQLADASRYYNSALELCAGTDMCSYIRYRRAWLLHRQGKLEPAIREMHQALWDSKGRVREEALRDLLVFLSQRSRSQESGKNSLSQVEALAGGLGRPGLIRELAEAFYSSGNREAGTFILAYLNDKSPSLELEIRLMEQYYGFRDWEKFRSLTRHALSLSTNQAEPDKSLLTTSLINEDSGATHEKILRRLTVQLDGERLTQKDRVKDFQDSVRLYLVLYPKSGEIYKMMDGWLASETDDMAKIQRIGEWEKDERYALSDKEKKHLREVSLDLNKRVLRSHAASAQKNRDHAAVIEALESLEKFEADTVLKREYRYLIARAFYELKRYREALPLFKEVASITTEPDKWAIQAQHLTLDILNQTQSYGELVTEADRWLEDPKVRKASQGSSVQSKEISGELLQMKKIREEANFQKAVQDGNNANSLSTFVMYCLKLELMPKSCENAKVLAVQLKDQKALLSVLKIIGTKDELASEYEASGYFSESAKEYEKILLNDKAENYAFLKVALLHELGNQGLDRNRVLLKLIQKLKRDKAMGEEEAVVYSTIKAAGLVSEEMLKLPWSEYRRAVLANALEERAMGSSLTKKILLSCREYVGEAWAKTVLQMLRELDKKQETITFYGANSQRRFEKRIAKLKELSDQTDKYYAGADTQTRIRMAALLRQSYETVAKVVLETPIPKEVEGDALKEVKRALSAMAEPFREKALSYQKLADEEKIEADRKVALSSEKERKEGKVQTEMLPSVGKFIDRLHHNPVDRMALEGMKKYYENLGNDRVSSYFQGRLKQLEEMTGDNT